MEVFNLYAPFIKDYIYHSGWKSIRAVQNAAGNAIFGTDDNVLITASTASGKTEAAFFPILSILEENPSKSIGVLYIAPLKALINDQFERLCELCEEAHIRVTRWHGDASQTKKHRLLKKPSGILQITPESLESLIINKNIEIPTLFRDLRFIVIDEIHSLLNGDRGGQTFCLIERLCRLAGCNPRRIGLSATIGNPEKAGELLAAGSGKKTIIPHFASSEKTWHLSMEHFFNSNPKDNKSQINSENTDEETQNNGVPKGTTSKIGYIFEHTKDKKCLIFTNSRGECESICQHLRQYSKTNSEPNRFLIHHGNLSKSYRQNAEDEIKNSDLPLTVCATSTLELGVDIGRLERAFQIGAPYSISSFLQRMGRTGRRGTPSEMWLVIPEDCPSPKATSAETISWQLIQSIAMIQLYIEERFVEPPKSGKLPFSLLYHQTMSTIASCGEMTPAELASRVLSLSAFHGIAQDDYRILLRHLIKIDHINYTENKGLIIGIKGEKIVNNYNFYAVFQDDNKYSVRADSEEIGIIANPPPVNEKLAIAGRIWQVEEVDYDRYIVYCTLSKGNIPASFSSVIENDIHIRVLERMYKVLSEDKIYPYLMGNAVCRLNESRKTLTKANIFEEPLIHLGGKTWALFPWLGSDAFLALYRFLKFRCAGRLGLKDISSECPYYIQFSMQVSKQEFYKVIIEEAKVNFDPLELIDEKEIPIMEKYDEYVPPELIRKSFAYGILDIESMKQHIFSWKKKINGI